MPIGSPQWMYASGDFTLDQSLRFNDDDSAYLSRTPTTAGNRRTWTWSGWVKRGNLSTYQTIFAVDNGSTEIAECYWDGSDNSILWHLGGGSNYRFYTNAIYRDSSAWYHIICSLDTTISSPSGNDTRMKLYVNGEQVTSFRSNVTPSLNYEGLVNLNTQHEIGKRNGTHNPLDGYLAEVHFIDGTALTPSSFGETGDYGEWKPKEVSGVTYGTNGFYLPFKQDYTVEGFSATTYTGNGTNLYVGGVGFQPDWVWIKDRGINDGATYNHVMYDAIRGVTVQLRSDSTQADGTQAGSLTAFNTDGFTLGSHVGQNTDAEAHIAWCWDMGGSNASNTNGSITSTVRANTTYGQSIVSYTGNGGSNQTVGHGLSSTPDMVILRNRSDAADWNVGHIGLSTNEICILNTTSAKVNVTTYGGGGLGARGATTFTLADGTSNANNVNASGNTFIAYCFHSVTGYSKFGSYTGNATSGKAITTGFAPAFVMTKRTDAVSNWIMWDNTRNPQNTADKHLLANSSSAEASSTNPAIDFTSTGFELAGNDSSFNASGGTYIYMAFADKREYAYWLDQSGNNNDWTSNNLTESDIVVDSPTNNFATWNPLDSGVTSLAEGNLSITTSGSNNGGIRSTMSFPSGKWYTEVLLKTVAGGTQPYHWGIGKHTASITSWVSGGDYAVMEDNGSMKTDGSNVSPTYNDGGFSVGDIIGIAVDVDNNQLTFYKNNVSLGAHNYTIESNEYFLYIGDGSTVRSGVTIANFGQDSSFAGNKTAQGNQDGNDIGDFYYTPPTGFLALCTSNLPDVAVIPSEHFNTVLYSGNGSTQSITGVGFQPDFTWFKNRNSTQGHELFDVIRGVASSLRSHNTDAENTDSPNDRLTSFDSDGFSLGADGNPNNSSNTYVAWNWKANGSGSSNTDGSITSTVSANVDAGFSIVTYTGNGNNIDVGHGLSKAPDIVIVKERNSSGGWYANVKNIPSQSGGTDMVAVLNENYALDGYNVGQWYFGSQAPTSSVFRVQNKDDSGANGSTYVAYCFHSVDGYSKVGSYTGNGNDDGTFIYTGFRPAFIIVKCADAATDWLLFDNKRNTSNPVKVVLYPNLSNAEETFTSEPFDFTSNGFKSRKNSSKFNGSGSTYIYLAFAETPFKYSNAR